MSVWTPEWHESIPEPVRDVMTMNHRIALLWAVAAPVFCLIGAVAAILWAVAP